MSSQLRYRLFEERDLSEVLNLWEKHSGWGGITVQQFYDWHINTPYGPCMIVVSVDEQDVIVGQLVFVPSVVYANGTEKKAYRAMAPIIHNDFKRDTKISDFNHPAYAMLRCGMQQAKENEYPIIYFFPSIGWIAMFKTFPEYGLPQPLINLYACSSISLSKTESLPIGLKDDYYIQPGTYTEEYDALWNDSTTSLPVQWAVKRSFRWLKWKRGGHFLFEMRDGSTNNLKAYLVIKDSGLVVDLLARSTAEMTLLLQYLVCLLHKNSSKKVAVPVSEIKLIQSPVVEKIIQPIPHNPVNYRFAFVCVSLNGQHVNERELFIMPDD